MPADIREQAAQSLENLKAVLEAASSGLDKVVKTSVFLADLADFAAVNEVYAKYFATPFPARSCFQVAALPPWRTCGDRSHRRQVATATTRQRRRARPTNSIGDEAARPSVRHNINHMEKLP